MESAAVNRHSIHRFTTSQDAVFVHVCNMVSQWIQHNQVIPATKFKCHNAHDWPRAAFTLIHGSRGFMVKDIF